MDSYAVQEEVRHRAPKTKYLARKEMMKLSKKIYTLVEIFESRSNPDKEPYEVKRDQYGELSCNCPGWVFKANGERTCRHVQEVENR